MFSFLPTRKEVDMTEAVILSIIALVGIALFFTRAIVLVKMILISTLSKFLFGTKYGHVEVRFNNTKADEK